MNKNKLNHLNRFKEKLDFKNFNLIEDLIKVGYFKNIFELNDYIRGVIR